MENKILNIGIFGLGVTGKAVLEHVLKNKHRARVFNSQLPSDIKVGVEYCLDSGDKGLLGLDFLILSPGIPRSHDLCRKAMSMKISVISEIEWAYLHASLPIIAVTGTNGKTTTVSLLTYALREVGLKVLLGGNIGVPFVSLLEDQDKNQLFVLELSSFQLESIDKFKAKISVLLNCHYSHEERYPCFEDYFKAKLNLFKNIGGKDCAIVHRDIKLPALKTEAQRVPDESQNSIDMEQFNLIGEHNRENILFCLKIFSQLKKSYSNLSTESFLRALKDFRGLDHRMERFYRDSELELINDSKSTNFFSTLKAVESLKDRPLFLAMGGKVRQPMDKAKKKLLQEILSKVDKLYCFGEAVKEMVSLKSGKIVPIINLKELKGIKKGVLLFSPGYPSFDQFKNYQERGTHFKSIFS